MLHPERHTYLNNTLCGMIPQKVLNRVVHRALQVRTAHSNIPLQKKIVSEETLITTAQNIDLTRAKQGFGRWALPKLKKELHHPDFFVVLRALTTILELVHDPEKTFEALRLGFVERLIDLLVHSNELVRERVCMIYYVLGQQMAGRRAIVRRYQALANLSKLLDDEVVCVRHKAQTTVEMISRQGTGLHSLNYADYTVLIIRLIGGIPNTENNATLLLHLMTLNFLLDGDVKKLALEHNCIDILMKKIDHEREDICVMALACLMMLCWDPLGKAQADAKAILFRLKEKLFDKRRRVHTKAAGVITFATHTRHGKHLALSLDIMDRLLELIQDFHCTELQLNSIKALTNLSENPTGRSYLISTCNLSKIENIHCSSDDVQHHLNVLLDSIKWTP